MFFVAYQISILDWGVETFRYCGAFQLGMGIIFRNIFKYLRVFSSKVPQKNVIYLLQNVFSKIAILQYANFFLIKDINQKRFIKFI